MYDFKLYDPGEGGPGSKREEVENSLRKKFHTPLFSKFAKAIREYELLKPGDKVAVCISGGKDSMLMAKLFQELKRHDKFPFELEFMVMDPGYREENRKKIEENEVIYDTQNMDDADYMIVAYGTASRICKKAIRMLRAEGIKVGLFRPVTLWPFPKKEIAEAAKKVKKILTVEMSMGQMVQDVQINAGKYCDVDFLGRPGGMLPEVEKIVQRVKSYV